MNCPKALYPTTATKLLRKCANQCELPQICTYPNLRFAQKLPGPHILLTLRILQNQKIEKWKKFKSESKNLLAYKKQNAKFR